MPFHPKFLPKGRILTYLEGPGIYTPPIKIQVYIYIPSGLEDDFSFQRGWFSGSMSFRGCIYIYICWYIHCLLFGASSSMGGLAIHNPRRWHMDLTQHSQVEQETGWLVGDFLNVSIATHPDPSHTQSAIPRSPPIMKGIPAFFCLLVKVARGVFQRCGWNNLRHRGSLYVWYIYQSMNSWSWWWISR